jgi:hypothetical protein
MADEGLAPDLTQPSSPAHTFSAMKRFLSTTPILKASLLNLCLAFVLSPLNAQAQTEHESPDKASKTTLADGPSGADSAKPEKKKKQKETKVISELERFLTSFETAVNGGDWKNVPGFLEAQYLKTQRDGFHEGNTARFLDELLAGPEVDKKGKSPGKFLTAPTAKIIKIRKKAVSDLVPGANGRSSATVQFLVSTSDGKHLLATLTLIEFKIDGNKFYRLVGAVG